MYVIAIHYAPGAGEAMIGPLAEALGKTPFEVRARTSDPEGGPAIVARYGEIEQAWACLGRLRANGISPILMMPEDVETDAQRFLVRSFQLGARGITAVSRRGESAEIAYGEIDLILRGARFEERTEVKTTERRELSIGRTLLTGGLILTKNVRKVEQVKAADREELCQLYVEGRTPLVFRSSGLDYRALGSALQPSVQANFTRLVAELRRALPQARYDERLANSQARARILGPGLNDSHIDIVISLLARVLRGARPPAPR
jgi:hypothetical protein